MMVRCMVLLAGLLPFVLVETPASAAIISYSEAVSGDLGDELLPKDIGTLGVGSNTVTGHMSIIDGVVDWDQFLFTVAANEKLDSIQLTLDDANDNVLYVEWALHDGFNGPELMKMQVDAPDSVSMFAALMPLPSDTYMLRGSSIFSVNNGDPRIMPYTFTLNVSSTLTTATTPEPTTLTIWGLGALGCAAAACRKRKVAI